MDPSTLGIELPRVEQWRFDQMTDSPKEGDLLLPNP